LDSKYDEVVTFIEVLQQPSRVVVSRATGPAMSLHAIVLVKLGVPVTPAVPTVVS
jgi:hypothetical protein